MPPRPVTVRNGPVKNLVVPNSEARNGGAGDAGRRMISRHTPCSLIRDIRSLQRWNIRLKSGKTMDDCVMAEDGRPSAPISALDHCGLLLWNQTAMPAKASRPLHHPHLTDRPPTTTLEKPPPSCSHVVLQRQRYETDGPQVFVIQAKGPRAHAHAHIQAGKARRFTTRRRRFEAISAFSSSPGAPSKTGTRSEARSPRGPS
jgi:hypothetical protein